MIAECSRVSAIRLSTQIQPVPYILSKEVNGWKVMNIFDEGFFDLFSFLILMNFTPGAVKFPSLKAY